MDNDLSQSMPRSVTPNNLRSQNLELLSGKGRVNSTLKKQMSQNTPLQNSEEEMEENKDQLQNSNELFQSTSTFQHLDRSSYVTFDKNDSSTKNTNLVHAMTTLSKNFFRRSEV